MVRESWVQWTSESFGWAVLLQTRASVSEISHRTGGGFDIQLAGVANKLSAHFVLLATGSSRKVKICSLENCYVFLICIFKQYCDHFIIGHLHLLVTELWRLFIVLRVNKVETIMNNMLVFLASLDSSFSDLNIFIDWTQDLVWMP